MLSINNIHELIRQAESLSLYYKLLAQLDKDFLRADIRTNFHKTIAPNELKITLHETVFNLIQYQYPQFLNLLYLIDVSETEIKKINENDTLLFSQEIAFLILKREWLKVWYKANF